MQSILSYLIRILRLRPASQSELWLATNFVVTVIVIALLDEQSVPCGFLLLIVLNSLLLTVQLSAGTQAICLKAPDVRWGQYWKYRMWCNHL